MPTSAMADLAGLKHHQRRRSLHQHNGVDANKVKLDFWQPFRLFLMHFASRAFALVKERGLS